MTHTIITPVDRRGVRAARRVLPLHTGNLYYLHVAT